MGSSNIPAGFAISPLLDGPFSTIVGPLYMRESETGLRFAFRTGPQHSNVAGLVHGGLLMTFADQVLGLTIHHHVGPSVVTVSLTCDFVSSAKPGDLIEGEATVTRITRSLVFVKGEIFRGGTVLVNASGLWMRMQKAIT